MRYSVNYAPIEVCHAAINYAKTSFLARHLFGDKSRTCRSVDPQYRKFVGELNYCGEVLGWQNIVDRVCQLVSNPNVIRGRLTPNWFFFGEPGVQDHGYGDNRTYLPISIAHVGTTPHSGSSESYDCLDTLVADLDANNASHGILLYGKTGGGKTVATKAVELGCFFGSRSEDGSLCSRHAHLLPVRLLPSDGEGLPEPPKGQTHHRDDLFHILFRASRWDKHEDPLEWIKFQLKYLGKKLLVICDLNAVDEKLRPRFALALRDLQKDHDCRVIVTYRSTRSGDSILTDLLSGGVFSEYQLRDVHPHAAKGYLRNLRELEQRVCQSVGLNAPERDVDTETEQLDLLVKQHESRDNSLISTPLLMHFVSLLEPGDLQAGMTLTGLYDRVIKQFFHREIFNYGTNLPAVLRGEFGFENFRKIMSGVALDILSQGADSVRLSRKFFAHSLLRSINCRNCVELINSIPASNPEAIEPTREVERAILELSVLNRSESEIGFVHDSLVYYFASLAIVDTLESDDAAGLEAVVRLVDQEPIKWLLVAEFVAGGLRPNHMVVLLACLIAACQRDGIAKLLLALANNSIASQLPTLIAEAIRHHGTWCHENPDAILSTVYNWLVSEAEHNPPISTFLEQTLMQAIARSKRPWLRNVFGSTKQSCLTLDVSDGEVVIATSDENGTVYFVTRSPNSESRHSLREWHPKSAESRVLISFDLPGIRPEICSITILPQPLLLVSGCSTYEPSEAWLKAAIHPDNFPKRFWLFGLSQTDDGDWITTYESNDKLAVLPPSAINQPIVCINENQVELQWLGREWDTSGILPIDFGTTGPSTSRTLKMEKTPAAIARFSKDQLLGVHSDGELCILTQDGDTQQRCKLPAAKYIGLDVAPDKEHFIARASECAFIVGDDFEAPFEVTNGWFLDASSIVYALKSSDRDTHKVYFRRIGQRSDGDKLLLETHGKIQRVLRYKEDGFLLVCKGRTFHFGARGKLVEASRYAEDVQLACEIQGQLLVFTESQLKIGMLQSLDDHAYHEFEIDDVFEKRDRENARFLQHTPVCAGEKLVVTDENSVYIFDTNGRVLFEKSLPFDFVSRIVIRANEQLVLIANDLGVIIKVELETFSASQGTIQLPEQFENEGTEEGPLDHLQECFPIGENKLAFVFFKTGIQIFDASDFLISQSAYAPQTHIQFPDVPHEATLTQGRFDFVGGNLDTGFIGKRNNHIYRFGQNRPTSVVKIEGFYCSDYKSLRPHLITLQNQSIARFQGLFGVEHAIDLNNGRFFEGFHSTVRFGSTQAVVFRERALEDSSFKLAYVHDSKKTLDLSDGAFVASDVAASQSDGLLVAHYYKSDAVEEKRRPPSLQGKVILLRSLNSVERETVLCHDHGLTSVQQLADRRIFVKERERGWAVYSFDRPQPIIRSINLKGERCVKFVPCKCENKKDVIVEFAGNQLSIADVRTGLTIARTYVPEVPIEVILHGKIILCKLRDRWTGIAFENTLADDELGPLQNLSRFTERIELNELLQSYFTLCNNGDSVRAWVTARIRDLASSKPPVNGVGEHLARFVCISVNQGDYTQCDRYIEQLIQLLRDLAAVSQELTEAGEQVAVALLFSAEHVVLALSEESQSTPIAWHHKTIDLISRDVLSVLRESNSDKCAEYNNFLVGLRSNLAMHYMRQRELATFLRCFDNVTVFKESTWDSLLNSEDCVARFISALLDNFLDNDRIHILGFTKSEGTRWGIDAWIAMLEACVCNKRLLSAIEDSPAEFSELIGDAFQHRRMTAEAPQACLDLAIGWCSSLVEWRIKSDECLIGNISALLGLLSEDPLLRSEKAPSLLSRVISSLYVVESSLRDDTRAEAINALCVLAQRLERLDTCELCVRKILVIYERNSSSRDVWRCTSNCILHHFRSLICSKMWTEAGRVGVDYIQFRKKLFGCGEGYEDYVSTPDGTVECLNSSSLEEFFEQVLDTLPDLLADGVTRVLAQDGAKWPILFAVSIGRLCQFSYAKITNLESSCLARFCSMIDEYLLCTIVQTGWLRQMLANSDALAAGHRETHQLALMRVCSCLFKFDDVQTVLSRVQIGLARVFLEWRSSQDLGNVFGGIEVGIQSVFRQLQAIIDYLENHTIPAESSEFDDVTCRMLICAAIVTGDKANAIELINLWSNSDGVDHSDLEVLALRLDLFCKEGFLPSDLLSEEQLAAADEMRSSSGYPKEILDTLEIQHPVHFLSQFDDTKPPPVDCLEWLDAISLNDLLCIHQLLVQQSLVEDLSPGLYDGTEQQESASKKIIATVFTRLRSPAAICEFWRAYDNLFTERLLETIATVPRVFQ